MCAGMGSRVMGALKPATEGLGMLIDFSTRGAGRGQHVEPALNGDASIHRNSAPFRSFQQGNCLSFEH